MGAKIDNSWQRRTFSRTETFIRAGKVDRVFWAGYRICFSIMLKTKSQNEQFKTRIEVSHKRAITAGLRSACQAGQAGEKVREIKEDIFHIIPSKELFTYLRQKWKQELQRSSKYLPKIWVKTPKRAAQNSARVCEKILCKTIEAWLRGSTIITIIEVNLIRGIEITSN